MSRRSSSALCLAALAGLVAVAWFAESRRGREVPCDPGRDELAEALLARTAERARVGAAVLAGRLSLLEAAARFRATDRAMPEGFWERFGRARPDDSDQESYCRQVIGYVTPDAEDEGGWELVFRLEAELREHRSNGTLRLPEPATPLSRTGSIGAHPPAGAGASERLSRPVPRRKDGRAP